jgi:pimeloyl-ACP methyl ester carboxylesterase
MPRIVTGEGALYYERQGVGFPVLFVTGLSGFASFWQEQVAAFSRKFDVVTHDHRGIGQSDPTRSGFTVDRMAVGELDQTRRLLPAAVQFPQGHPAAPRAERLCPGEYDVSLPELVRRTEQ